MTFKLKPFNEMIMFDHVKLGAKHSYLCTFMCPGKQANCPSYNWESKHSCWQIVMRGWGRWCIQLMDSVGAESIGMTENISYQLS